MKGKDYIFLDIPSYHDVRYYFPSGNSTMVRVAHKDCINRYCFDFTLQDGGFRCSGNKKECYMDRENYYNHQINLRMPDGYKVKYYNKYLKREVSIY